MSGIFVIVIGKVSQNITSTVCLTAGYKANPGSQVVLMVVGWNFPEVNVVHGPGSVDMFVKLSSFKFHYFHIRTNGRGEASGKILSNRRASSIGCLSGR